MLYDISRDTPIDRLYNEAKDLQSLLLRSNELSLLASSSAMNQKALLLAIGSYFEYSITHIVLDFSRLACPNTDIIPQFLLNKSIKRQFHTWFDWKSGNANSFFQLFGTKFLDEMKTLIIDEPLFKLGIGDFIALGNLRNQLAHTDFATYSLNKTLDEIFSQYKSSLVFISKFSIKLEAHLYPPHSPIVQNNSSPI